ncbi:hypothetical protein [Streptosporangium saharense]|uniref:Uncharacterized protein n=1 Tax=Streptosporangium saharense TaxID=1706840 RepID=A0A7W7QGP1_9ACTN|nr:hypothetical protein [Streptosporangium saharense]MBB4913255.1 hypothetical protein [Streptosporangium saharense]
MGTDATFHLERLRAELIGRSWAADVLGTAQQPVLRVRNPAEAEMHDEVVCQDSAFLWAWGGLIGPVTNLIDVTDRIMFVLREVAP